MTKQREIALNEFINTGLQKFTRGEISTWLVLFQKADERGVVSISMAEIGKMIGTSPRSVVSAIHQLLEDGIVRLVRKGNAYVGPSIYHIPGIARAKS